MVCVVSGSRTLEVIVYVVRVEMVTNVQGSTPTNKIETGIFEAAVPSAIFAKSFRFIGDTLIKDVS